MTRLKDKELKEIVRDSEASIIGVSTLHNDIKKYILEKTRKRMRELNKKILNEKDSMIRTGYRIRRLEIYRFTEDLK